MMMNDSMRNQVPRKPESMHDGKILAAGVLGDQSLQRCRLSLRLRRKRAAVIVPAAEAVWRTWPGTLTLCAAGASRFAREQILFLQPVLL